MTGVTISAESGNAELFGKKVNTLQSKIKVEDDNDITGNLKFVEGYTGFSGDPALQSGNFIALKFSDIPATATSVKVGLEPSRGSGLVEIINDPDKNGVFRIDNKFEQNFKIVTTDGTQTVTQIFDLSRLNVQE